MRFFRGIDILIINFNDMLTTSPHVKQDKPYTQSPQYKKPHPYNPEASISLKNSINLKGFKSQQLRFSIQRRVGILQEQKCRSGAICQIIEKRVGHNDNPSKQVGSIG
ncbi:hypothetical protein FGO68_gene7877 [Halteria grandinella]|uniref:Uncharacterized protein n=1 Tax=Halteria grandinella TaxID=5974 RepID=A0A8J8SYC9_HALGN|nr:hypothetical protein FGO68_gene7877 [Halteria grandinella]